MSTLRALAKNPSYVLDRIRLSRRPTQSSSISDNGLFPAFCSYAAGSTRVLRRFRRSPIFEAILEHTSVDQGDEYWQIARRDSFIAAHAKSLAMGDTCGGPRVHPFGHDVVASPSLMRYLKVAADLHRLFGDLSGMRIVELGGGYGGQARVLTSLFSPERYTIIDLPEVALLQRRYLAESSVDLTRISFVDGRKPVEIRGDLLISNYAVSELARTLQEHYSARLAHFPMGYVTFNHMTTPGSAGLTAVEFTEPLEGASIEPETPLTGEGNVLITWGSRRG